MSLLHALPCLSVTVLPHPAVHFPAMACGGALSGGSSFSQTTTTSYSLNSHLHNRSDDINEALQNLDRVLQGEWIWKQPIQMMDSKACSRNSSLDWLINAIPRAIRTIMFKIPRPGIALKFLLIRMFLHNSVLWLNFKTFMP